MPTSVEATDAAAEGRGMAAAQRDAAEAVEAGGENAMEGESTVPAKGDGKSSDAAKKGVVNDNDSGPAAAHNETECGAPTVQEDGSTEIQMEGRLVDGWKGGGLVHDESNEGNDEEQSADGKAPDKQSGAAASKKRKAGELDGSDADAKADEESATTQPEQGDNDDNFVTLRLTLPPPPQLLGLVLQDDKQHNGLPILVKLLPESPLQSLVPQHLLQNYWIIGITDETFGEAQVWNSQGVQAELKARRNEGKATTVELTLAKKGADPASHYSHQAWKKRRTEIGDTELQPNDDECVALTLTLPPPPRPLGLVVQDDPAHRGLAILMAVSPDSPFKGVIPPHLPTNYWLVKLSDETNGTVRIANSDALKKELGARRKEGAEVSVEFTFKKRGAAMVPQQGQGMATQPPSAAGMLREKETLEAAMAHLQRQVAAQRAMAQQALTQQAMTQQEQIRRQRWMQQFSPRTQAQLGAARTRHHATAVAPIVAPAPRPAGSEPTQKRGRTPKGDEGTRAATLRRALSEFFVEGEARPLKTFCQEYSRLYSALCREISNHPGLCAIRDKRKDGEGFTKEDSIGAIQSINEMFSRDYVRVKLKKGEAKGPEAMAREKRRPCFPPLKPKGECKGLQSKVLEDYCSDERNDQAYLYERLRLSNFKGWRHRDCPFIGEIDKNERCTKCVNARSNVSKGKHPVLFDKPKVPKVEEALLPKSSQIRSAINSRLDSLEADAATDDPQLALIAQIMKIKGKPQIELGKTFYGCKNLLIVCEDCGCHVLKQKASNTTSTCSKCARLRVTEERKKKNARLSREDRVSVDSKITWKRLSSDEQEERYQNLRTLKNTLARKLQASEERNAKQKAVIEYREAVREAQPAGQRSTREEVQQRAPLLPWPFYLNYNPVVAGDYTVPEATSLPAVKRTTTSVSKSLSAAAKPAPKSTAGEGKNDSPGAAPGNPPAEDEMEESVAEEEIAEEPLDHASVGSLQEDKEGGKAEATNLEEDDEFDGQLV